MGTMKKYCSIGILRRVIYLLCLAALPLYSATFLDTVRQAWTRDYYQLKNWSSPFGSNVMVLDSNSRVRSSEHPFDVVLRRSLALIQGLKDIPGVADLSGAEAQMQSLQSQANSGGNKDTLYYAVRGILRQLALRSNPLLNFDRILFIERGICGSGRLDADIRGLHFCDQNFGPNGMGGGGLLVLTNAFTDTPRVVDLLQSSLVQNGRLAGRSLNGGAFKSPELSFDGSTVYFAWTTGCTPLPISQLSYPWSRENCFHLFQVNADGGNLRQLTDTCYDDFDPACLPNGRIAFISTRRQGFGRCHARPVPTYTLFSMKNDGSDIICLSYHETNEFSPSVDNDGMMIYTRWDYVDRDASIAHHLWRCYPDGRDPRAPHGNYPLPFQTIIPPYSGGGIEARPMSEFNFRSIPGGSNRYICVAGPHHGEHYGSVILVDREIEDDGAMSQVTVITPETGFPEINADRYATIDYGTPWPLSEDFYIVSYKDSGLYYLDRFGNRELLCTKTRGLRAMNPIPLRPRKRPNVLPTNTFQEADSVDSPKHKRATLTIKDVMVSDMSWKDAPWAAQRKIKWLRIVQFFSKTTPYVEIPKIGYGTQQEPRMSLGLAPVEADGSVNCEAPVGKSIYFQLLDSNLTTVQSMRSVTYVHAGEQLTCTGCHETKWNTPSVNPNTLASRRRPSKLMPEADGLGPMTYYRAVKPVFDSKCVRCHRMFKQGPQDMSYGTLKDYAFYYEGNQWNFPNPVVGGSRTLAGSFGASYSRMGKALLDSMHRSVVSADERRRVFMWLDLLSNEYGDFFNLDKQANGERIWPTLDMDSINPQGVEWDRQLSNYPLDVTAPSVPQGLQAQALGSSRILLSWQASQDAESGVWAYRIYRNGVSIAYTCSTWFRDSYLKTDVNYSYQVAALNLDNRESGKSSQVSSTTQLVSRPSVPQNVTAVNKGYFNGYCKIDLNWQAAVDAEFGIWYYRIFRNDTFTGISVRPTYSDSGLAGETSYSYRVSAVNFDSAESDRSPAVAILTPADTIPPELEYVSSMGFPTLVTVAFSEPMESVSATDVSNYSIDNGITILSAILTSDLSIVQLRTSPLVEKTNYLLTINNVRDRSVRKNPILPDTRASFTYHHNLTLVLNPSFEFPVIPGYQYNPADTAWTFGGVSGSGSGIEHNGSAFGAANAPNGVQAAFLQNTGSVTQLVSLDSGTYRIRFKSAQRGSNVQTVKVYIDGVELGSFTPANAGFSEYVSSFTIAATGAYQLKIAGTVTSGDHTAFIDEVVIEASGFDTKKEHPVVWPDKPSLAASPNPFNPIINISVAGWRSGTELKILNVSGRVVADLTRVQSSGKGQRRIVWNASGQASGVYLVMLKYGAIELKRKILLVR